MTSSSMRTSTVSSFSTTYRLRVYSFYPFDFGSLHSTYKGSGVCQEGDTDSAVRKVRCVLNEETRIRYPAPLILTMGLLSYRTLFTIYFVTTLNF